MKARAFATALLLLNSLVMSSCTKETSTSALQIESEDIRLAYNIDRSVSIQVVQQDPVALLAHFNTMFPDGVERFYGLLVANSFLLSANKSASLAICIFENNGFFGSGIVDKAGIYQGKLPDNREVTLFNFGGGSLGTAFRSQNARFDILIISTEPFHGTVEGVLRTEFEQRMVKFASRIDHRLWMVSDQNGSDPGELSD